MTRKNAKKVRQLELKRPEIDEYSILLKKDKDRLQEFLSAQEKSFKSKTADIRSWEISLKEEKRNYDLVLGKSEVVAKAVKQLLDQAEEIITYKKQECENIEKNVVETNNRLNTIATLLASIEHEEYREALRIKIRENREANAEQPMIETTGMENIVKEVKLLSYSIDAMMQLERGQQNEQ